MKKFMNFLLSAVCVCVFMSLGSKCFVANASFSYREFDSFVVFEYSNDNVYHNLDDVKRAILEVAKLFTRKDYTFACAVDEIKGILAKIGVGVTRCGEISEGEELAKQILLYGKFPNRCIVHSQTREFERSFNSNAQVTRKCVMIGAENLIKCLNSFNSEGRVSLVVRKNPPCLFPQKKQCEDNEDFFFPDDGFYFESFFETEEKLLCHSVLMCEAMKFDVNNPASGLIKEKFDAIIKSVYGVENFTRFAG